MVQAPDPYPAAGEVLLSVSLAGICATDVHIYHGHFKVAAPRILGHELAGVVEAVGPGVDKGWLGKTCGVRPAQFCGKCEACLRGNEEFCLNFQCLGNTRDGGYAEKTLVNVGQLVDLPGLGLEALVWLEPLACVMKALDLAQIKGGEAALVIGAGVMGQLFIKTLRALRFTHCAIVDPNLEKITRAVQNGAEHAWVVPRTGKARHIDQLLKLWDQGGPQIVIDTTGKPEAFRRASKWVGVGGRIILFGVPNPQARLNMNLAELFHKGISVRPCNGMTADSFRAGAALLASHRLDPTDQAAVHINLSQVVQTFREGALFSQGKVFIHPGGGMQ